MNDNELRIIVNAKDNASAVLRKVQGQVSNSSTDIGNSLDKARATADRVSTAVTRAFTAAALGVAGLAIGASKAAFDQVRQVENASFALRAYEKDAGRVNDVLGELVAFARSDMGVLFQRQELFKAAANLKAFGEDTDRLTDRVKILARGVSLGMTTFDELSQIIGRASQAGALAADEYDMLASRGIVLDRSFRGTKVSAEALYQELSRVLPEELLRDRANTIDGIFIRMQSAFRDLGGAILGVDKATSTFVQGGLGDRLIKGFERLTEVMSSAEFKKSITDFVNNLITIGNFIKDHVLPALMGLIDFLAEHEYVIIAIVAAFVALKAAMFLAGAIEAFTTVMLAAKGIGLASAGAVSAAWAGVHAVLLSPIALPAIAVGAALAALWQVRDAAFATWDAVQNTKRSAETLVTVNRDVLRKLQAQTQAPYDPATIARAKDTIKKLAQSGQFNDNLHTGGPVAAGQSYVVGESQAEVFTPNTAGRIMPSTRDAGVGGETKNILSGNFYFSTKESVDAFFTRLDKTQRLAKVGMG